MPTPLINHAFNTQHAAILVKEIGALLVASLESSLTAELPVNIPVPANEEYEFWANYHYQDIDSLLKDVTARSIKLHHPHYIGHQVTLPLPLASAVTMLASHLNNGMAVYEMGAAASAIDRWMIEAICPYFGYGANSSGIFTSGGTIANVTALLCARAKYNASIWTEGTNERLAFMVSDQAHYCIDRAVRIMGLGTQGIVSIPTNDEYYADGSNLEEVYQVATAKGLKIIGIVGSAPSTASGTYDNLVAFGQFAQAKGIYYHIDGAHGGPAAFSPKYKHLMYGSEMADSITIDAHKMMLMPALTTMLLFRQHEDGFKTFAQEASYLFDEQEYDWSNYGKRTMECTKIMLGLRLYACWKEYGADLFREYVEQCYDRSHEFAQIIQATNDFELGLVPQTNILCFRPVGADNAAVNAIREAVFQSGEFYIVKTMLRGQMYLRCTVMNPYTSASDFNQLLDLVRQFK